MKLRYGTEEDIAVVKPYLIKMWLMHDDEEHLYKRDLIETTDLQNYFKETFDGSGKSYLIIAEDSGKLAGFCKVTVTQIERFFREIDNIS